jgi:hypothetical protein
MAAPVARLFIALVLVLTNSNGILARAQGAPAKDLQAATKPQREIVLSSVLGCKRRHFARGLRFAPTKDTLAVVLEHSGAGKEPPGWHLVLVSRDGAVVRELAHGIGRTYSAHKLYWDPESDHLAVVAEEAVSLVRASDGRSCRIPVTESNEPIGFVQGPLLVVYKFRPSGTLEFYGPDCGLQESHPSPSGGFLEVAPGGDAFAFLSDRPSRLMIAGARGQSPRSIELGSTGERSFRLLFADFGRVVCFDSSGVGKKPYAACFAIDSLSQICTIEHKQPAELRAASVAGSRLLFAASVTTARCLAENLAALPFGQPGNPCAGDVSWRVWDYRDKAEVLRVNPMPLREGQLPPAALAPRGDALAIGVRGSVLIFDVPLK